ncbi:hypothetical protein CP061683_0002A, partial [Chlamydia psittaci 06-1683]
MTNAGEVTARQITTTAIPI